MLSTCKCFNFIIQISSHSVESTKLYTYNQNQYVFSYFFLFIGILKINEISSKISLIYSSSYIFYFFAAEHFKRFVELDL